MRDLALADAELLERAGVPTTVVSGWRRQHVNGISSDGRTYVGSAFPWAPMTTGGAARAKGLLTASE